ncbi:hypothetical protein PROSTU_03274 [Providencia stuartii ATCC 25827]|uniref:Uncharacterized protein n=1 Tax=Providencia stuartii ATCC 25827 TaxID=471874 RepID=A0AA86YL94_PROST|nr:hypothetical protein PROSTU_03274 [Providencia stuartii ATCC 25827]
MLLSLNRPENCGCLYAGVVIKIVISNGYISSVWTFCSTIMIRATNIVLFRS